MLRRMVPHTPAGDGGWMSSYMFYMGSGSPNGGAPNNGSLRYIGLRPAQVTANTMRSSAKEITEEFSWDVSYPASEVEQHAGAGRSLDGVAIENANRSRRSNAEVAAALGTLGLTDSLNKSLVLQHCYMSTNVTGDDTTAAGAALSPMTPYVITPLDSAVITDTAEFPFTPILDMAIDIVPEVTANQAPETLPTLARLLESRLRDSVFDYELDGEPGYASRFSNPSNTLSTDNPHMLRRDNSLVAQGYEPWYLFMSSTNMEVDDYKKIMRLIGTVIFPSPNSIGVSNSYNSQLLKFTLVPGTLLNPNGLCVVAVSKVGMWHSPIVGFLSNDRTKIPGVDAAIPGPVTAPSCQIFGFTGTSTDVVPSAISRSPRTVVDTIRINKPGVAGVASYFVERYARNLIGTALTSHLPKVNPDGSESTYFELGTFVTRAGSYAESMRDAGPGNFCLQPVAFAMAQQPEDTWLYYVSMDDTFTYWLNRQELGKAHISEALSQLHHPPLQMEVFNGKLWMIFDSAVHVYDIASKTTAIYSTAASVPSGLRAIAIDRMLGKVYIGHLSGVFEFTGTTVTPISMPTISAEQKRVAKCSMTAVNGYIIWVTSDLEDRASSTGHDPNFVVRHQVSTSTTYAWSGEMLAGSGRAGTSIISASLRSNGDCVVLHSGIHSQTPPTLVWFAVNTDGSLRRRHANHYFGVWGDTYNNGTFRLSSRIFRIDDLHYSLLVIPVKLVQATIDGMLGMFRDTENDGTQPYTCDFRLEDSDNRIYYYPVPKTARMRASDYVQGNTLDEWRFVAPYVPIPWASVYVRACDYEYARYSSTVVILDRCYSLFVCGTQIPTSIGVELSWNGTEWVHGTANVPNKARVSSASSAQAINPWTQISFASGVTFNNYTAYKIRTYPKAAESAEPVHYYLGDLIPATRTVSVTATEMTMPADIEGPTYCGIEYERPDLLTCIVGGTTLTYATFAEWSNWSTSTPATEEGQIAKAAWLASHFSMYKNTVYLDSTSVGKSMTLTYSYVKAL